MGENLLFVKTGAFLTASLLLLLTACTATSPAPGLPPVPGTSGSPVRPVPGGAGESPSAMRPRSPATRDVALLELIAAPDNPLGLRDDEKGAVRDRLRWIADSHERTNFRKRTIQGVVPDLWRAAVKPAVSKERDAEEAFLADAAAAEAELRQKAGGGLGEPVPLPSHLPPPGKPPEEMPDEDVSPAQKAIDAVDLQMLGVLLTELAAETTPEQARKLVPEIVSLQEYVKDLEAQYELLRKLVLTTPEREQAVEARAGQIPWEAVDLSVAQTRAMEWADSQK